MSDGGDPVEAGVSAASSRANASPDSTTRRCIDGIISIYQDGSSIMEKIRGRGAQGRADPLLRLLEESIHQALEDIEREKHRGITRFGKAFEDGDQVAVIALQQVTIQTQHSLLVKLKDAAAYEDEVLDSSSLIDAADIGRDKSIAILLELRIRLFKATPVNALPMPGLSGIRRSQDSEVSMRRSSASSQGARSISNSGKSTELEIRIEKSSRDASRERDAVEGANDGRSRPRRHRHSSILSKLRHHRSGSDVSGQESGEDERRSSSRSHHSIPRMLQNGIEHVFSPHEENPASTLDVPGKQTQVYERRETLSVSSPSLGTADVSQAALPRTASGQLSTIASVDTSVSKFPSSFQPTPENDYLGFCKGAARLQTGDRTAMQKTKEFNDGWSQSVVYYLTCSNSKCAFAAHLNIDTIWSKVWDLRQEQGLRFRWAFLAKSHVPQNNVKNGQINYQCLFCVFLGYQASVITGTDSYLEHVSQEHRGQKLGEVVLYRTACVNDRICDDGEDFDINLIPPNDTGTADLRNESEVIAEELSNFTKARSDTMDSTTTAREPWNEGLSDFHYLEELTYTHSLRSFRSRG